MSQHDDKIVRVAKGEANNLALCRTIALPWSSFRKLFYYPIRTPETHETYRNSELKRKNYLKSLAGWFLGAPIEGNRRNRNAVLPRQIITLDFDKLTPETYYQITHPSQVSVKHYLSRYEMLMHTTRSHTPENPRLRAIVLCDGEISNEKFEAVARILAWHCDAEMEMIDPASFRLSQMMYLPTVSQDQEYWHGLNPGSLLNADELLNSWGSDWTNFSNLPRAKGDSVKTKYTDKAERPEDKKGVIGAFCRAYTIQDAVDEFLPDIYGDPDTHSAELRYTYLPGESQFGAVVYDNCWMFSWHGTDPAGDQLCNAFDLVRIHKFGELDTKNSDDDDITSRPSYKAMVKWANQLPAVMQEKVADTLDTETMFVDYDDDEGFLSDEAKSFLGLEHHLKDLPEYPGQMSQIATPKEWYKTLEPGQSGIKPTVANILKILTHDPRFKGCCQLNAFTGEIMYRKKIKSPLPEVVPPDVIDKENGDLWSDLHDAIVKAILSAPRGEKNVGYGLQPSNTNLSDAVRAVSKTYVFHPVIEHLMSLPEWDQVPRVDSFWIDYLNTPDNQFYRESARIFFIGAVARLFFPGISFDFVPILMGEQGRRKTTLVRELGYGVNKWGKEFDAPFEDRNDCVEQMKSAWILEMSEIHSIKHSEIGVQKKFITRTMDRVRLSYDRRMSEFKRQCVFIGTSNEYEFLKDHANRRYWPIRVNTPEIETDRFIENRDQIWAEALYKFMLASKASGHNPNTLFFYLSKEAGQLAETLQQDARVQSIDEFDLADIQDYLDKPVKLSELYYSSDIEREDGVPDPLVLRIKCNAKQILSDCLHENIESLNPSVRSYRLQAIGHLMQQTPNWVRGQEWGNRHHRKLGRIEIKGHGKGRGYIRADATLEEFEQGYRLHTEEGSPV